jgi:N-methylhydantoinase A
VRSKEARRALRVGIDIGGTFTDLVALDDASGELQRIKVPSTPREPERAVLAALGTLLRAAGADEVALVSHSSTVATNALLGQINLDLPRIVLLTTEGFRDVLEIGRQNRSEVYNLFVERPRPLVERRRRLGVRERMDAFGNVAVALDAASLEAAMHTIEEMGADVVAVAYLHAYANPAHERATRAALAARFPEVRVVLSSDVDPEYREYERTSTTVVNALLGPLVGGYLERLARGVRALDIAAPISVMQSHGGVATPESVAARPATLLESGPAAGVIAAAYFGRRLGFANVLSFDMGGTTAKAGTIADGRVQLAFEFEAAGRTHSGRVVKGSGYPVRFPFVDLAEIGAGGGTLISVDAGGALRVGPLSAGADPGPAAYGVGTQPTVTDANIVLGRLNPRALLGGALPLDAARAATALAALLPKLPELDLAALAAGAVRIVDAAMAKILRIVTVERGLDPRAFTLVAFGGGGPLHACAVAAELNVPRIVIPPDPGLFSAFGLLAADARATAVRSILQAASDASAATIESNFAEMEAAGAGQLRGGGIGAERIASIRELDMRYLGQGFELTVAAAAPFEGEAVRAAVAGFHDRHERTYGYASRGDEVEIVAARSTVVGSVREPELQASSAAAGAHADALLERRRAWTGAGWEEIAVYERSRLPRETRLAGPVAIEQYDTTTFVAPGWEARVAAHGILHLERADA